MSPPYPLGTLFSTKANTFYCLTGLEFKSGLWYYKMTRVSKRLTSQGNCDNCTPYEFKSKYKVLTDTQKLLFLQEETTNV